MIFHAKKAILATLLTKIRQLPPLPRPPPPPSRPQEEPQALPDEVLISASTSNIELRPSDHSASSATASERVKTNTDLMMHRKWVKLRHFEFPENNKILRASDVLYRFYCDRDRVPKNNGCEVQEMSVWLDDYEFLDEVAG